MVDVAGVHGEGERHDIGIREPRIGPVQLAPQPDEPGAVCLDRLAAGPLACPGGLNPLGSNQQFLFEFEDIQSKSLIQINWAFTPTSSDWELNVYEGSGTGGVQVLGTSGSDIPAIGLVQKSDVKGGVYTVRFFNNSSGDMTSEDFGPEAENDKTWVRTAAFKDYLITSTAGPITLTVLARQGPGPSQAEGSVYISTWDGPS